MPSTTTEPKNSSSRPAWTTVGLLALFPLAVIVFGGVHEEARAIGAALFAVLGAVCCRYGRYDGKWWRGPLLLTGIAILGTTLAFVPVGPELRAVLQPGVAGPVQAVLEQVGVTHRPLALDPWRGLIEWSVGLGLVLVGAGTAGWVTRVSRARVLVAVLLVTGVAVVGLAMLQSTLDLTTIYGFTNVPAVLREPFFGPYVNANHGGALCAALAVLALTDAVDGRGPMRGLGLLALAVLVFGVWASGSRGGVVALVMGLGSALAFAGGRSVRWSIFVAFVLSVCSAVAVGLERTLAALSNVVAPEMSANVEGGYIEWTTGRTELFEAGSQLLGGVAWFGVGPAGYDDAYRVIRDQAAFNISTHAHNEALQIVIEHGWLVALAWLGLLVLVVHKALAGIGRWSERPDRQWRIAGFLGAAVAMGVSSLVDFPLRIGSHALLVALVLGAAVGLSHNPKRGIRPPKWGRRLIGSAAVAVLVAVGLTGWGEAGTFGSSDRAMTRGIAAFEASRSQTGDERARTLASSKTEFERAIGRQPVNRRALQWLARSRTASGDAEGAAGILSVAVDAYPTMPWLWRDRARLARMMGEEDIAREAWKRMLACDLPGAVDPKDYVREAIFGGEFDETLAQARSILPDRPDRVRQGAMVLDRMGFQEEAEALFRHALARDPTDILSYASALMSWGRPGDVLPLLASGPDGCKRWTLEGQARLAVGHTDMAADAFSAALGRCGAQTWALRAGLAAARLRSGDPRGMSLVARLLEERPDAHGLRRATVYFLARRGAPGQTVEHLEHLLWAGVATPVERTALERARMGLPFSMPPPPKSTFADGFRGTVEPAQ